jgi:hypothetical protein
MPLPKKFARVTTAWTVLSLFHNLLVMTNTNSGRAQLLVKIRIPYKRVSLFKVGGNCYLLKQHILGVIYGHRVVYSYLHLLVAGHSYLAQPKNS